MLENWFVGPGLWRVEAKFKVPGLNYLSAPTPNLRIQQKVEMRAGNQPQKLSLLLPGILVC